MTSLTQIEKFFSKRELAVAGVSRDKNKFGNHLMKELLKKKYSVYPINPNSNEIDGVKCIPDVSVLPQNIENLLIVTNAASALQIIGKIENSSIKMIWFVRGSFSEQAIELCNEKNIETITNLCPFMFLEPVE